MSDSSRRSLFGSGCVQESDIASAEGEEGAAAVEQDQSGAIPAEGEAASAQNLICFPSFNLFDLKNFLSGT